MPPKIQPKTQDQFIQEAKEKYGNKYDYSKVIYVNRMTDVIITCPEHGKMEIKPYNHLRAGCPDCNGVFDKNDWIEKVKLAYQDRFDYSKTVYVNAKTKLTITCLIHNKEFPVYPHAHIRNKSGGCPDCAVKTRVKIELPKTYKYTTQSYIEAANLVHNNFYNYSNIAFTNTKNYIDVICPNHGPFRVIAGLHLSGSRCAKCAGNYKLSTQEFIEKAQAIHLDKYDYTETVYTTSAQKVTIKCLIHGLFTQEASSHLKGSGCSKCSGGYSNTTEEWIERAIQIHGDKYDYSKSIYSHSKEKLTIICKTHGPYYQTPSGHLRGGGCAKCSGNYNYTTEEFIEIVKVFLPNHYDYSKTIYQNGTTVLTINCGIHGEFHKTPDNILSKKTGCPMCSGNGFSKGQLQWLAFLMVTEPSIQHILNGGEHRIKNSFYHADGFNPETNTIYEYDGDYYHGNPKIYDSNDWNRVCKKTFGELYQKTLNKKEHCLVNGYNFKSIWESDWEKGIEAVRIIQKKFRNLRKQHSNISLKITINDDIIEDDIIDDDIIEEDIIDEDIIEEDIDEDIIDKDQTEGQYNC